METEINNTPAEPLRCETCLYWEDFNGVCFAVQALIAQILRTVMTVAAIGRKKNLLPRRIRR